MQEAKGRILKSEGPAYLGLSSVPLPFPVPKQAKARWEKVLPRSQSQTLEERQRQQDIRVPPWPCILPITDSSPGTPRECAVP